MKCQSLFSEKNIINLLHVCAELAHRVVMVNLFICNMYTCLIFKFVSSHSSRQN